MNKQREIHFTQDGQFLGRNGLSKAIGLEIVKNDFNDMVIIRPVNSKKLTGASFIAVPQGSIPELIDTLRLFLEGGSDTAPDPKAEKIAYIVKVLGDWGGTSTCELELDHSPVINSMAGGNIAELVEEFTVNGVSAVTYDDDMEIGWNDYNYDELSDDVLDEIVEIMENYEADMEKTQKRCEN
jgi:hypothetical protein